MILTLYVARHGETDWNRERRLQGGVDVPLNATGLAQARELAEKLRDVSFAHLYVSALTRARATADALPASIPRTVLAELNERRLGEYEGVHLHAMDPAAHDRYRARKFDPEDVLGDGESLCMHRERVRRALMTIRDRHQHGNVLIVGHGATNAMLLSELQGREPHDVADLRIDNGTVYRATLAGAVLHELMRL